MFDRGQEILRSRLIVSFAIASFSVFLSTTAEAGRIDRLIWNALRFSQQAEFFQQAASKAGLPLASFDLRYETTEFASGHFTSMNPGVQLGMSDHGFLFVELPLAIADWEGSGPRGGIGDLLLEYQHVLYAGEGDRADALVLALDLIAPTGDSGHGLGEGAWVGFPSLTGVMEISDRIVFAPSASYLHSFSPVRDRATSTLVPGGRGLEADARRGILALNLVHFIRERSWLLVSPDFTRNFESGESTFDLRAGLGIQFNQDFGANLQFSEHLDGPALAERSLSLSFSYFF